MQWNDVLDPTRNMVTAGAVYPASGGSVAAGGTGGTVVRQVTGQGGAAPAGAPMPAGSFIGGMVILAVLIAATMFVVHKWGGDDGNFSNVRASAYNIFIIALLAAIGIPVLKVGSYNLAQTGLPGSASLWTWMQAA